jgi:monoamine oxidase
MDTVDVIVVGAGLAGLTAARRILEAKRSVRVIEARARVGGRVHTTRLSDGTRIDLGAQWIGPGQTRVAELVRELGLETFPTFDDGESVVSIGGKAKKYKGTIPSVHPLSVLELGVAIARIDWMAKKVPLDAPWTAKRAKEWDGETMRTFIDRTTRTSVARELMSAAMEVVFGCDPAELSLLHALFYVRAGGDLDRLLSTTDGAQRDRIVLGAQSIAEGLCSKIGDAVILESPVRRIDHGPSGVVVRSDRAELRAERAIVAVPPTIAGRIAYDPALPFDRDQLTQRFAQGNTNKCFAMYPAPFWRKRGLSGQAVGDEIVRVTFDASPPNGSPGVLLGFLVGPGARVLGKLPPSQRKERVLRSFAAYFGEEALSPIEYRDHHWADEEWTRGCPTGYLPPGAWTSFGSAVRSPIGPIHWAGTESATAWSGYMDGAIQSGERAAGEVLAALGGGR